MLQSDTNVELIAIENKTHKVYKKIIEIQEFSKLEKKPNFNYYLYQIGFSQYKDAITKT